MIEDKTMIIWILVLLTSVVLGSVTWVLLHYLTKLNEVKVQKIAATLTSLPIVVFGEYYLTITNKHDVWANSFLGFLPIIVYVVSPRGPEGWNDWKNNIEKWYRKH